MWYVLCYVRIEWDENIFLTHFHLLIFLKEINYYLFLLQNPRFADNGDIGPCDTSVTMMVELKGDEWLDQAPAIPLIAHHRAGAPQGSSLLPQNSLKTRVDLLSQDVSISFQNLHWVCSIDAGKINSYISWLLLHNHNHKAWMSFNESTGYLKIRLRFLFCFKSRKKFIAQTKYLELVNKMADLLLPGAYKRLPTLLTKFLIGLKVQLCSVQCLLISCLFKKYFL